MTARTGWRRAAMAGAMMTAVAPAFVPAMADVRAGVAAWARGDYPRAIAEWRGPALAGDADAQFNLGQAYKLGRGVSADLAQAESWYRKAAVQGHAQAQDNYALALFQDGRKADALAWLEKSVARDEKRTELVLGTMLFNGDGVPKDWVRAYGLVSRSSQQGLPQASKTLAQMDGYLSPEERQQGVALAGQIADQGRAAQMAALATGPIVPGGRGAGTTIAAAKPDIAGPPPVRMVASTDLPPSTAIVRHPSTSPVPVHRLPQPGASSDHVQTTMPMVHADGAPAATVHRASPPTPTPARTPTRTPAPASRPARVAVASGGHWRVQLGAFRDEGNARALWARIGSRIGGQPVYARAGAVVRLQAGPFASKADADRACHAAATTCVVVP